MVHEQKILPCHFGKVKTGETIWVKNDKKCHEGDILIINGMII